MLLAKNEVLENLIVGIQELNTFKMHLYRFNKKFSPQELVVIRILHENIVMNTINK